MTQKEKKRFYIFGNLRFQKYTLDGATSSVIPKCLNLQEIGQLWNISCTLLVSKFYELFLWTGPRTRCLLEDKGTSVTVLNDSGDDLKIGDFFDVADRECQILNESR